MEEYMAYKHLTRRGNGTKKHIINPLNSSDPTIDDLSNEYL